MWKDIFENKTNKEIVLDKNERFQRLALKRVKRALVDLDLIANLTTNNYYCTEEQAMAITDELRKKLNYVEKSFETRVKLNNKRSKL